VAVALIDDQETVLQQAYGWANIEQEIPAEKVDWLAGPRSRFHPGFAHCFLRPILAVHAQVPPIDDPEIVPLVVQAYQLVGTGTALVARQPILSILEIDCITGMSLEAWVAFSGSGVRQTELARAMPGKTN
jgi:hypothetical protein